MNLLDTYLSSIDCDLVLEITKLYLLYNENSNLLP